MILDPESFSMFKYTEPSGVVWMEFEHQFKMEFSFDSTMQTYTGPFFNAHGEWQFISTIVEHLESQYPVLGKLPRHLFEPSLT